MKQFIIPENYHSDLNLHDTQVAIKTVKDFFQSTLTERLNLLRVSAPLFVTPQSGLNDNLNGVERPVSFGIKEQNDAQAEDRPLSRQVETLCSEKIWFFLWRRSVYRHERHPPG